MSSANGQSPSALNQLYQQFQANPTSVPPAWQVYFRREAGEKITLADVQLQQSGAPQGMRPDVAANVGGDRATPKQNRVSRLIQAYRSYGHKWAHINPLGEKKPLGEDLNLAAFGLDESDLKTEFATDGVLPQEYATLQAIIEAQQETYTHTIGVQYASLPSREERAWLRARMEEHNNQPQYDTAEKKRILQGLIAADGFEQFLHKKFVGVKRFSIEGGDVLIPMMDTLIDMAAESGVEDIVMGMAHRGRMNMLANIFEKPMDEIFAGFSDTLKMSDEFSSGDVKYHQGKSYDVITRSGHKLHMSLLANPSHLEAVNPVVAGSAYAKQRRHGDKGPQKVLPVLIHGDSSFAGQGVVAETLAMANLEGFKVGGTVHIVINNQVGFTANPDQTFSGEYCTDIARMLQIPIFHVNADDVEACNHVMQLAASYRQHFGRDVLIDLVCYRRYGHNEGDDPSFTQPLMYEKIKNHPRVVDIYREKLVSEGRVSEKEVDALHDTYQAKLADALKEAQKGKKVAADMFAPGSAWAELKHNDSDEPATAVQKELAAKAADALLDFPNTFTPNPKVAKVLEKRAEMYQGKAPLDWGAGEMLAYAGLLADGHSVRLTGQDVERGTFSHRHIKLVDQHKKEKYQPIEQLAARGATLEVYNSLLSEYGVMGFEFGYSLAEPKTLTIWEAQFGDFVNGAQIIIDQFLSSSEVKWHRMSGLVLLLPHGMEGQGPEHSSARLERFLQLCAQNNMTVANFTTPAQIFHALRRQVLRKTRKPLVIMSPKSLLRHPMAVSELAEFTKGSYQTVLQDDAVSIKNARRVVLCSGKIYYDLLQARDAAKVKDVALVRVEQLYPLPLEQIKAALKGLGKAADIVWAQEEARNQGAWTFMLDNLAPQLDRTLRYIGRAAAASPAVGSPARHKTEQEEIMKAAFAKQEKTS